MEIANDNGDNYEILNEGTEKSEPSEQSENLITLPVLSSSFNFKGKNVETEIKSFILKPKEGLIQAEGKDQFGAFSLAGKLSRTNKCQVNITKSYDSYQIDIVAGFNKNKLQGFWKNQLSMAYEQGNVVEFIFDLQELPLDIENVSMKIDKHTIYVSYLLSDNLSEYVGISYFGDGVQFLDASVYDITHVVYQISPFKDGKNYFTGMFDFDEMKFKLKQTELI